MEIAHVQKVKRLYKTILKLHRGLPNELQTLGTTYAKDEFKRHKNCNEAETKIFMNEWSNYALMLAEQLGIRGPKTSKTKGQIGKDLSEKDLEYLRDEQVHQLYELMTTATKPKSLDT